MRKFRDAENEDKATARLFREDLRQLYDIEREAQSVDLDDEADRAAITLDLRARKSRAIVVRILRRTSRLTSDFDGAGLISEAMKYLRNQRSTLITFLRDGGVPIDNNACERGIRPIAVGRRNWLFAGSMRGGRAAAVIYTLIESCKHAGVDPVDYFADVLKRVAGQASSEMGSLMPANWAPLAGPNTVPAAAVAVV